MATPELIARFLDGRRIAVAGVSRNRNQTANVIHRKLKDSGRDVVPVNPNAAEVEGVRCYPDLPSIPGAIDGVVIVTRPEVSVEIVRQAGERGVRRVWIHRAFGKGSFSEAAIGECRTRGIECIAGGCPLMYCEPVDLPHRCMRWWLTWRGRLPR